MRPRREAADNSRVKFYRNFAQIPRSLRALRGVPGKYCTRPAVHREDLIQLPDFKRASDRERCPDPEQALERSRRVAASAYMMTASRVIGSNSLPKLTILGEA